MEISTDKGILWGRWVDPTLYNLLAIKRLKHAKNANRGIDKIVICSQR